MKKLAVILILILVASTLWAQDYGKFGIGLSGSYLKYDETTPTGTNEDNDTTFFITGLFSAMLGESMELRPYLTYGMRNEKQDGAQTGGWSYFGGGVGFYWHLLRTDFFRMGPGVTADCMFGVDTYPSSDDATMTNIGMKIPMMLEFVFSKNIVFRMEYNMLLFKMNFNNSGTGDNDDYYQLILFPIDSSIFSNENELFFGNQILNFGVTIRF